MHNQKLFHPHINIDWEITRTETPFAINLSKPDLESGTLPVDSRNIMWFGQIIGCLFWCNHQT